MNVLTDPKNITHIVNSSLGYATHVTMLDGGILCLDCVDENFQLLLEEYEEAREHGHIVTETQWLVNCVSSNEENEDLYCSHCSNKIESIY